MALLLKHHIKIIKEATGEKPKQEISFCLFDEFESEAQDRVERGLKKACELLYIQFILEKIMLPELPSRFYYEAEPTFKYHYLIEYVSIIQFITEVLTIIHVIYILNIFLPTKVCHIHFKIISCIFLFDLILKSFMNIIVLSKYITGKSFIKTPMEYLICNIIQCTVNYAYYFYPMSIFAERTLSLLWAKSYEKYFSISFIAALSFLPIFLGLYITIHLLFLQSKLPIFYVYLIANIFANSYWAAYFIMYFCAKKEFNLSKNQTLSERYQRYENFRTSKTMFWFGASSLISILMASIYIQTQWHHKLWLPDIGDTNMNAVLRLLIDTAEGFVYLVIPIALTFIHPNLKKKYMQTFPCFFLKSNRVNATSEGFELGVIKSITGENLVRENEQEYHFTSMINEWEKKFQYGIANPI